MAASATKAQAAIERADALLREKLSPEQRADYDASRSFVVTTPAGRRYRLHADRVNFSVDLLAPGSDRPGASASPIARYCVQPREAGIPKSDALLAQMLLLQADEAGFLLLANEQLKVPEYRFHEFLDGTRVPPPREQPRVAEPRIRASSGASLQIQASYRCAVHGQVVVAMNASADGRGWRVRYACDCPTQYVSRIAHEERQAQLAAAEPRIRSPRERTAERIEEPSFQAFGNTPQSVEPSGSVIRHRGLG